MPGKDSEKLKKRKAKIKTATKLAGANKQIKSRAFVAAMKRLNETIEKYKNEKLDEERVSELCNSYSLCVTEASKYLENNKNMSAALRESVERVKRAMSKDLRVLINYDKKLKTAVDDAPAVQYTFNGLLEISRSKHIDVNVEAVDTAGAGQHLRAVIPTEKGKLYFTESEKIESFAREQQKLLDSYKKKYGAGAEFLNDKKIEDAMRAIYLTKADKNKKTIPGMADPKEIIETYKKVVEEAVNDAKKANKKTAFAENALGALDAADTLEKQKILFSYISDYAKMRLAAEMNASQGIHEGCIQDKRNSATTFVAEELGLGDLIAHSENVHIRYNDRGKQRVVKGTAMNAAKGEDFNVAGINSNLLKSSKSSLENPGLIKQVAGLQILDFLCGNADRHGFNFSYIVDENGNVNGIQGYDNDSSFGSKFQATGFNGKKVRIQDFGIIPESIADKIMKMDSQNLKLMLHGFDLDAKEIEGACERLEQLKLAITKSKKIYADKNLPEGELEKNVPRVVKDENIGEYSFTRDLAISEKRNGILYGNLFGLMTRLLSGGQAVTEIMTNLSHTMQSNAKTLVNDSWIETADQIHNLVLENPKRALGSAQYDHMLAETQNLQAMLKDFTGPMYKENVDRITGEKSLAFSPQALAIREKIARVNELTDTYLNERAFPRRANHKSKTSRAYKRFALAMKNKDMMADLEKCFSKIEKAYADKKILISQKRERKAEAVRKDAEFDKALDKKIEARRKKLPEPKKEGQVLGER